MIICHLFTHPATPKINGFDPQDFADWLRLHADFLFSILFRETHRETKLLEESLFHKFGKQLIATAF